MTMTWSVIFDRKPLLRCTWLCISLVALLSSVKSQTSPTSPIPSKDVALLVDVSKSVQADQVGHAGARRIVQSLIAGRRLDASVMDGWKVDTATNVGTDVQALFAGFFPESASAGQPGRLTGRGRTLLSLQTGRLDTVLTSQKTIQFRSDEDVDSVVARSGVYPTKDEMDDQSTCYWFAMATAAETLSRRSRDGYYLFVVSDEEDDPDYRSDGPDGHSYNDYESYKKRLARGDALPVSVIRGTIERYFDLVQTDSRKIERYRARQGFEQVTIAKFTQTSGGRNKVQVTWYGMGVKPVAVPPVVVPTMVNSPVPAPAYEAPRMAARVEMLGGIHQTGGARTYDYANPFIVFQVRNGDAMGSGAKMEVTAGLLDNSRRGLTATTFRLSAATETAPKEARVSLPDPYGDTADETTKRISDSAQIRISPRSDFWLNLLAIISGVAAIGIFFIAWRQLRENRVVMSA